MQITSSISAKLIGEYKVEGDVDMSRLSEEIYNKEGVVVQNTLGLPVNGFLASEKVGNETIVYIYAYTEDKPQSTTKMRYTADVITDVVTPEIKVVKNDSIDVSKLGERQVILE